MITIDWGTKVINVPKAYLTVTANPNIFNLDTDVFRLDLKELEAEVPGIVNERTHTHNTEVPLGGVIYARVIEIINGYTITFENGFYAVNLFGSNNNIGDVVNLNFVSVRTNNAAGLIVDPGISESLDYGEHVIYDEVNGVSGSTWPVGTYASPVNNNADLQTLLTFYGRSEVLCLSDVNITQNFYDISFISKTGDEYFNPSGFKTQNCSIGKMVITGDFNHSKIFADQCSFNDVQNMGGTIYNSVLFGDITQTTDYQLVLYKCSSTKLNSEPVYIDMVQGVDTVFGTRGHSGPLFIGNCDTSASTATVIFEAGSATLSGTCSDGLIVMGGICSLTDESTSGCTVDITGVIDPDTSNNIAYGGKVNVEDNSGFFGTNFPNGTLRQPVDNLTDAIAIATERGLDVIHIHNDWTFVNGTFINDFTVEGDSLQKSEFTFQTGAVMLNCNLRNAKITGDITGMIGFDHCHLFDVGSTNPSPSTQDIVVTNCLMDGMISLTPAYSGSVKMIDCYSGIAGSGTPEFNVNGAASNFFIRDYTGGMRITNSDKNITTSIDMISGNVIFDPTVSGGTYTVRGVSLLEDNSSSGATVISTGLVDPERINTIAYDDKVHILSGSTYSGTDFPNGTAEYPVNNLTDALVIANERGIETLAIVDDYFFPNGTFVNDFIIQGHGLQKSALTFEAGSIFLNCTIKDAKVSGEISAIVGFDNCHLLNIGSVNPTPSTQDIIVNNCLIDGTTFLPPNYSGTLKIIDCWSGVAGSATPILDFGNSNATMFVRGYIGGLEFRNFTGNTNNSIDMISGNVIFDSSLSGGTFVLRGISKYTDNSSSGCTVDVTGLLDPQNITVSGSTGGTGATASEVAIAVWDELTASHSTSGTFGKLLTDLIVKADLQQHSINVQTEMLKNKPNNP